MTSWAKRPRRSGFTTTRAPASDRENEHSATVEWQIEVIDPARHLGEEYRPSVDIQRR